jgi:hypothetical protein
MRKGGDRRDKRGPNRPRARHADATRAHGHCALVGRTAGALVGADGRERRARGGLQGQHRPDCVAHVARHARHADVCLVHDARRPPIRRTTSTSRSTRVRRGLQGPGKIHWLPLDQRADSQDWRDLGIDEDEVPDTTRASMDGQVSADMSFETWLKKQSRERQDTVLGESKADLWRRAKSRFGICSTKTDGRLARRTYAARRNVNRRAGRSPH